MSLAAIIPAVILDTILGRLAGLFLTGADGGLTAARHAAAQMLLDYDPQTPDELRLAAEIISFGFHALEALGQAASPDISINHTLRLRGSAVSLSRASHRAQRRLDQLQKARRAGVEIPVQAQETPRTEAKIAQAIGLIEVTRDAMVDVKVTGQTWTQAYQQRQRAKRIALNLKKNNAVQADPAGQADGALNPAVRPTVPSHHAAR